MLSLFSYMDPMDLKLIHHRLFPAPDRDQLVSPANPALSPSAHPANPSTISEASYLSAPLQSTFPSPAASSRSTAGSPGPSSTLPALPVLRGPSESSTTSPEDKKAESSIYYTTAWGSPYAAPSPRRLSWSLSQHGGIDRDSDDSSPVSIEFGLEPNRPGFFQKLDASEDPAKEPVDDGPNPPAKRRQAKYRGKSIQDFTQDWINQYISGRQRTERSNWLSDDSGSEAPSFITAQNHFADDLSDDWLGLENESRDQDLLKTPTLADFVNRRATRREGSRSRSRVAEALHRRGDTLRQEDFWGFAYDKDPPPTTMSETKETQPSPAMEPNLPSPVEKPLPPPPVDEKEPSTLEKPGSLPEVDTSKSQKPAPQRQRKKIPWRGKGCIIDLPLHDKRGTEESGYRLLTPEDVKRSLKHWEELGYDVRGFSVGAPENPLNLLLGGASRPSYPELADLQDEITPGNYTVSFPNKALWDEYVNFLQEEKLRALGVFGGDDDVQASPSPASALNPAMTPFPGLVSSPPIPTGSAASNPLSVPNQFSPQLTQGPAMSNGIASLASPPSQFGIQAPFYGVDQGIIPGFLPFQPTPPAQGSLTPQSFINLRQNGPASTIPGTLSSLSSMLSPVSPITDPNAFHAGWNDQFGQPKDAYDKQTQQRATDPFVDDQLRPLRTPPNPENFHASTVEIAQPTPRGHSRGHNLSETLQRGIDRITPDYPLEESIERELDGGDHDKMQNHFGGPELLQSRWALPGNNISAQHLPQHLNQFYGEHYAGDAAQEGSDIDTNPSLSGTPRGNNGPLAHQIPWHESKPSIGSFVSGHRSKHSASSLNVDAKEFAPTGAPGSQALPFHQNPIQFPTLDQPMFTFGACAPEQPSGRLNVAAPEFTPGKVGAAVNFGQDVGSREFKFSAPASQAPSLSVTAPEFNPGRTKIFGDIDLSGISESTKKSKSKAIPIVRPDEEKEESKQEVKDEHGRTIFTDRHKRSRHNDNDPHDEAHYKMSNALAEAHQMQSSQPANGSRVPAEGKENALPGQGKHLAEDTNHVARSEDPVVRTDTPVSEASTWAPSEAKAAGTTVTEDVGGSEEVQQIIPEKVQDGEAELQVSQEKPSEQAKQDEHFENPIEIGPRDAEASATAKTFSFKPSIAEFVPVKSEAPAPPPKDSPKDKKGLMASRYAVASSPPSPPAQQVSTVLSASAETDVKKEVKEEVSNEPMAQKPAEDQDSPDEGQLNAIMEQLNGDSDVGIERLSTPRPSNVPPESVPAPSKEKPHVQVDNKSDPPSPSPGRGLVPHSLHVPKLDFDAQSHYTATPSKGIVSGIHSPVRRLLSRNEGHVSDWDDMISSGEEVKLANRSRFFDRRINDLLSSAIDERFYPFEQALSAIQQSLAGLNPTPHNARAWRSASAEALDSDADDEDEDYEEDASYRTRSPLFQKERKLEKLKSIILEALATREAQPAPEPAPNTEIMQLRDNVIELHGLLAQKMSEDPTPQLVGTIQEVIANQLNQRVRSEAEEIGADSLMLQIDGLKKMLRMSDERAESEYKKFREAQDSVVELRGLLKDAQDEAARHSAAAESAEARLLQLQTEKIPYFENVQIRVNTLEKERESDRLTLDELSAKNIALQNTIDEHRVTSDNAKRESEEAKARLEKFKAENLHLRITVGSMKTRIEEGLTTRQDLSKKLDRLQDEMASLVDDVTREQASLRRKEEEQTFKYNELRASHNRETKLREQLEIDIAKLEEQEREAAKLRFIFGQSQQENARLEELVHNLRQQNHESELKAAHFERAFMEARESSMSELQRTKKSLETDLDAANTQVNIVRAELEAEISRLQTQLDNVKMDSDTAQERYEMLLEEARETKAAAIQAKELAMEEQRKVHERVLNDLRERHARALHNSSEDKARTESYHSERLAFSEEKARHLQERVAHLEEKLEITQSAARAAAEAAQSAKAAGPTTASHSSSPSMSLDKGSSVPEKISPQALRESILVLQDQLQQRETRIDELEHELSMVDKEAPAKIKERDTEITWLRELLGVRLDDLQDIINTLSQPSFDQNSVRDAAIRLRANLQMQQQEKERAMNGQNFPSLPSLSNLTASPRALPLAAAAAWGNWRKSRVNSSSNASEQTPSKSSPASAFLSGLLTPPSSNTRQTGPTSTAPSAPARRRSSESRSLNSFETPRPLSSRAAGKMREPPSTPPLLRTSSYDRDAEPADYTQSSSFDEEESTADYIVSASPKEPADHMQSSTFGEEESTADGLVSASPKEAADNPFGPRIA
ncbi:hypothetical protein BJX61DRAFT_444115 [Aspergillus egyptiacus]|nr:hypothetical protein BJX61DRAFT_444115 [Aspergillus egyptiacus]